MIISKYTFGDIDGALDLVNYLKNAIDKYKKVTEKGTLYTYTIKEKENKDYELVFLVANEVNNN